MRKLLFIFLFSFFPLSVFANSVPIFSASKINDQSVTSGTLTKITFETINFNLDGAYSSSTSRFQPTEEGYYQLNLSLLCRDTTSVTRCDTAFYKNGSLFLRNSTHLSGTNFSAPSALSTLIYLNGSTDYVEFFGASYGTSPSFDDLVTDTQVSGHYVNTSSNLLGTSTISIQNDAQSVFNGFILFFIVLWFIVWNFKRR